MRKAQLLLERPHTRAVVVTRARHRSAVPGLFVTLGLVVAVVAGGWYLQQQVAAPEVAPPEQAVDRFLAAVFVAKNPYAVADTVCQGWLPEDALARTAGDVGPGSVTWGGIGVVSRGDERITAKARLSMPGAGGIQQWRFNLVLEDGWRVCEARPFTV